MEEPKAIIKDGKVINAEQLRYYWRDWREQEDLRRQNIFEGLRLTGRPLPALETEPLAKEPLVEETELEVKPTFVYFKNDIRALELNGRVIELENSNKYLIRKLKELTASASKRKTNRYKGYVTEEKK